LALESGFVNVGDPETLVMVYRVEPSPRIRETAMSVVKLSESKFAIPNTEEIQLGTQRYYREYEGEGKDIRDDMEARFQEDLSHTLWRSMGLFGQRNSFSAQTTWKNEDHWLFCTSIVPKWDNGLSIRRMGKEFDYDCGTEILDPGAFAQELGAVFASHTSWADVKLDSQHKTLRLIALSGYIKRTICVYHGPMCYPTNAAKVVYSFPEPHQTAIVPFQKRPNYGWQREYRFAVKFLGEPQAKTLRLPITTELRRLANVVWEGSARGNQ